MDSKPVIDDNLGIIVRIAATDDSQHFMLGTDEDLLDSFVEIDADVELLEEGFFHVFE